MFSSLPGPVALRIAIVIVVIVVVLVGLFFLFEWAGDLLDSGGVVSPDQ